MDEQIVLLDEQLRPIGAAPKLASHHADTPLHLAFSCYLLNQSGQLLVTKRAAGKKVWPGVWTNSFCGHPAPGEAMPGAIARRGAFELGITELDNLQAVLGDYRYKTPPYNGIIENEYCPVYVAHTQQQPSPNPDEVEAYQWLTIAELQAGISANPEAYSYWLKDQLPLLIAAKAIYSN